jgi:hypothetical protein
VDLKAFLSWISCKVTSSTLESNWVTFTANLSILACKLEPLTARPSASWNKFPNISSACLESVDNCLMMLAKLPLVTPSNSSGTGRDRVPLHTATGTITLSGKGMVVVVLNQLQVQLSPTSVISIASLP